ncbi:MAG: Gfo/Idh/MocA family oxidoreductase [Verrucomicrobiota bacterium]
MTPVPSSPVSSSVCDSVAPITVAILGCGKRGDGKVGWAIGHLHGQGWRLASPDTRLFAVDPNPENLAAFRERFDLPPENCFTSTEALYAAHTPDYVSVCTWPGLHAAQVIDAAGRGVRGIACEKPLALDGAEIDAITRACVQNGTRLVVCHQRRHLPVFEKARELIASGALGHPVVLEARVADNWDMFSWTSHWFDMAPFLIGAAAESVLAGVDFTGERRYGHAVENASVVFVNFAGGHQGIFVTGPVNSAQTSFHLRGPAGMLDIAPGNTLRLWTPEGVQTFVEPALPVDGFGALLDSLIDAVQRGSTPRCDLSTARLGTEISLAAQESARTQRLVTLPLVSRFAPLEVLAHPSMPALLPLEGRVVLLADDHYGSLGRTGLAEALRAITGREVVDREASLGLAPEVLVGVGLVVLYHTHSEPSEQTCAALTGWVDRGRPLLLVHAALGAYPEWELYGQWCGRVWEQGRSRHPYEPSRLSAVPASGLPWKEAWLPKDEVFADLGERAETDDLCTAEISTGRFPVAWTSRRWPHIAGWVPGHRGDVYALPTLRNGLCTLLERIIKASSGS